MSSGVTDVRKLVEASFNTKGAPVFWHYTVKNCLTEKAYAVEQQIQKNISRITEQLGANSFERQEDHGFTPLHVVAIIGNEAGLIFLFKQKVNREIKDSFGKRPVDYAQEFHPELLDHFSFPHHPSSDMSPLASTLKKWLVRLPANGVYQKHTDDFGKKITHLLVGKPTKGCKNHRIVNDLKLVCVRLGIDCKVSETVYQIRDRWMRVHTGDLLKPLVAPDIMETALDCAEGYSLCFNTKAQTRTYNLFFKTTVGQLARYIIAHGDISKKEWQKEVESASFYFEGGNTYTLTNRKGKIKVLLGADLPLISLHLNRIKGFYKFFKKVDGFQISPDLSPEKVKQVAEELYVQGILKQDGHTGFLTSEQVTRINTHEMRFQKEGPKKHSFRKTAESLDLLKPFVWKKEDGENEQIKEMVYQHLWGKNASLQLTAQYLKVEKEDIYSLPQMAYHIDCFSRPGPNHSIFVQDYEMSAAMLTAISERAKEFQLSKADIGHLERYIATAKKLHVEFEPLSKETKATLEKADFVVIPTPGVFMYEPERYYEGSVFDKRTYNINFINALTGFSAKTQKYYYIVTGAQVGDRLGRVLMDMFHFFLQQYVPAIETHFIGRHPKNPENFSQPMWWWNYTQAQSGVHCATFEIDSKSHKDADEHKS